MPFPNQPSGATILTDSPWTSLTPTGWQFNGDGRTTIVTRGDCPESSNTVMQMRYGVGTAGGGGVGNVYYSIPSLSEVYIGFWWMPSNPWQGHPSSINKICFLWQGNNESAIVLTMNGSGPPYRLMATLSFSGISNGHLSGTYGDNPGTRNLPGSTLITLGEWHRVELLAKKSTTATSQNGIVRLWLDDVLQVNHNTVNYLDRNFVQFEHNGTWGGTGSVKTQEDFYYVDHTRIATGGAIGGGGGGGQVVLQSLAPASASITTSQTQQYVVTMSGPVPSSVSMFTQSSNLLVATTPDFVTVNAGQSTGVFTATPLASGATTISTSYNGVSKSALLQVQANPGGGGGGGATATYDYGAQFSGTQGQDQWYYLDDATNAQLTYDSGDTIWRGTGLNEINQTIWASGFHTGYSADPKVRWIAHADGQVQVTGAAYDLDASGGTGCTFRIKHNGATLFTRVINNGDTTGGAYDLSFAVSTGDTIDFVLSKITGDYGFNSTNLDPVIEFEADAGGGGEDPDPPPPPPPPITVVDFFASSSAIIKDHAFTMTVRLSNTVTTNTAVAIQVGSVSLLSSPTSVTVLNGESEASFTVTPIAAGLVAIDAVLNGTKRVHLSIQPTPDEPENPTEVPVDPSLMLEAVLPNPDGALIRITGIAASLAFAYDAQIEFQAIPAFPIGANFFRHVFTWPSGTTFCAYRVKNGDGTWGNAVRAKIVQPPLPPPPPPLLLAVIDKDGVEWQLRKTGNKKPPYQLHRNRAKQSGMLGVGLRKSAEGYMELLQVNGTWIRREGTSWVTVT